MDRGLFVLINGEWTAPWLDLPMAAASSWDFWWPVLVVGGVLAAVFGGFRWRSFLLVAGIAVGITDGLVVDPLKDLVNRPRPHEEMAGVRTLDLAKARPRALALFKPLREEYSEARILPRRGNSFPSGHASNNFALATVAAIFWRRWGVLGFLPAAVVSYSRIYVGSHWPLDVVVSCLIGCGVGFLTCAVAEALWQWAGQRMVPAVFSCHPTLFET